MLRYMPLEEKNSVSPVLKITPYAYPCCNEKVILKATQEREHRTLNELSWLKKIKSPSDLQQIFSSEVDYWGAIISVSPMLVN